LIDYENEDILPIYRTDPAHHPSTVHDLETDCFLLNDGLEGDQGLAVAPYIDPTPKFRSAVRKALKGLKMVSPRRIA
jgi:hypothetical protein